jgi:hypothetical protein
VAGSSNSVIIKILVIMNRESASSGEVLLLKIVYSYQNGTSDQDSKFRGAIKTMQEKLNLSRM